MKALDLRPVATRSGPASPTISSRDFYPLHSLFAVLCGSLVTRAPRRSRFSGRRPAAAPNVGPDRNGGWIKRNLTGCPDAAAIAGGRAAAE